MTSARGNRVFPGVSPTQPGTVKFPVGDPLVSVYWRIEEGLWMICAKGTSGRDAPAISVSLSAAIP